MKISILCPNVSLNYMGRAYILAKMLQPRYQVEIVGPSYKGGIWKPLRDDVGIEIKYEIMSGYLKPYQQLRRLSKLIDGNVLYASKPLSTSYLLALLIKSGRPLVLDIDDWEWGFVIENMKAMRIALLLKRILTSALFLYRSHPPHHSTSTWVCEKLIRKADQITVSNEFLRQRYGGTIIYHGRDAGQFVPDRWDNIALKKKHDIDPGVKLIMFIGSPVPHKGIEDLIEAVSLVSDDRAVLAVTGVTAENSYSCKLAERARALLGNRFREFGLFSFAELAEFIALGDVIVVPQGNSPASWGQMPAKIFDAMAMGKPIIATAVNDIPTVLEGCGWVVEPSSPQGLAAAIHEVITNRRLAETKGRLACEKFLTNYSWEVISPRLIEIFRRYEN